MISHNHSTVSSVTVSGEQGQSLTFQNLVALVAYATVTSMSEKCDIFQKSANSLIAHTLRAQHKYFLIQYMSLSGTNYYCNVTCQLSQHDMILVKRIDLVTCHNVMVYLVTCHMTVMTDDRSGDI